MNPPAGLMLGVTMATTLYARQYCLENPALCSC